jgi:hypothetical protein
MANGNNYITIKTTKIKTTFLSSTITKNDDYCITQSTMFNNNNNNKKYNN